MSPAEMLDARRREWRAALARLRAAQAEVSRLQPLVAQAIVDAGESPIIGEMGAQMQMAVLEVESWPAWKRNWRVGE